MAAVRDGEEKALRDATLAKKTHFPSEQDWLWSGRSCFFLFYLQCFVLILNGDSDTLGILVRRRCSRARSGGELFPPKKEEVTGDRFPSRQRVLFKSRVGASVERGDCSGGRGRFGDIFFLLFLPISPSLSIAVQESKEECKGQLGLNTLFFFLSLSLSLS